MPVSQRLYLTLTAEFFIQQIDLTSTEREQVQVVLILRLHLEEYLIQKRTITHNDFYN